MKIAVIIISILVILLVVVGAYFWYMMQQPLYKPGMVREGKNLRASLTPPKQSGSEDFWQVEDDIQLHHFSAGEGRNVLIIHGGPGYPYTEPWTDLDPLPDDYTLHYYDQRGCGRSSRPIDTFASSNYFQNVKTLDQTLGLGAQIADIERIRQILGDEKLILIGHSWGGFMASLYAAEFPEHVEALILIAPADTLVMTQDQGGGLFEEVKKRLPENEQAEFDAFMKDYLDYKNIFTKSEADLVALNQKFGEYFISIMEMPSSPQNQGEDLGLAGGWMVHAMYFSMGLQHDYREALKNVTAPVLVIHAENDLQSEAVSRLYVDAFPNSKFEVVKNATHGSFEGLGGIVKQFLEN